MKISTKRLISILVALSLLLALIPISAGAEQNTADSSLITEVLPDQKVYSNVTLEDDFSDDSLIVVIKKEFSEVNKVYAPEDFGIPDVESVEDLTAFPDGTDGLEYLNTEEFRQIFKLNLKTSIWLILHSDENFCISTAHT